MSNDHAEIQVKTRISTDIKASYDKPGMLVLDKKRKEMFIFEVDITIHHSHTNIENEKLRKYDLLATKFGVIHKANTEIIPYVMT